MHKEMPKIRQDWYTLSNHTEMQISCIDKLKIENVQPDVIAPWSQSFEGEDKLVESSTKMSFIFPVIETLPPLVIWLNERMEKL